MVVFVPVFFPANRAVNPYPNHYVDSTIGVKVEEAFSRSSSHTPDATLEAQMTHAFHQFTHWWG